MKTIFLILISCTLTYGQYFSGDIITKEKAEFKYDEQIKDPKLKKTKGTADLTPAKFTLEGKRYDVVYIWHSKKYLKTWYVYVTREGFGGVDDLTRFKVMKRGKSMEIWLREDWGSEEERTTMTLWIIKVQ